jgi:hypothetical protein
MAVQTSYATYTIWNAWTYSGIIPVIEKGSCVASTLDQDWILPERDLNHDQRAISEEARGGHVQDTELGMLSPT